MTLDIQTFHPHAEELIGLIPAFLISADPRPAAEQFDERYSFGGGWRPMKGWKHETVRRIGGGEQLDIRYPGDPPYMPVACITFREERIWIYQHAWVAIEAADGSVQISRMD